MEVLLIVLVVLLVLVAGYYLFFKSSSADPNTDVADTDTTGTTVKPTDSK